MVKIIGEQIRGLFPSSLKSSDFALEQENASIIIGKRMTWNLREK